MPRYSVVLKLPEGGTAIVCGTKPMKACICQAKVSAYLCDYPMELSPGTCDAPLCDDCRRPQGPNIDYCPDHDNATANTPSG